MPTHLKVNILPYIQVDASHLEKVRFSMISTVLVASVLPNLRCYETVFLKSTPMVRFCGGPIDVNLGILQAR